MFVNSYADAPVGGGLVGEGGSQVGILDVTERDMHALTRGFEVWLRRHDPRATVREVTSNAGGTGYSNATFFASVELDEGPVELVIRAEPSDPDRALFPEYDIAREFRLMTALTRNTDVPVPRCRWLEADPALFGGAFLVMDRVVGEIPSDSPPYLVEGMIVDADDRQRARLWSRSVELLARVHAVDWRACGLEFLGVPDRAAVARELDGYERIYRWGRQGSPEFPEVERALRWLRANLPSERSLSLTWGDARLPNYVYCDYDPVCLIDWETASLGVPESDLAWFLLRQFDRERGAGGVEPRPRPGGFLDDAATIALYEDVLGRRVRDLEYFRALNAFKTIAIKQRHYDLLCHAGRYTREQAEAAKVSGGVMLDELVKVTGT